MECRRAEEPFEPRPQSCLRFGISTLLVGALCIAVGLSYKDVPSAYAASRFAKEDVPSATMTVSGMLYNDNILFDCPYEMSNVTVNFYGDSHPSPEVKKSPYGDPITLSDIPRKGNVGNVNDRDVAIDDWLKPWILDTSAPWLPEDEFVTVMFWNPHGGGKCGEWIVGPSQFKNGGEPKRGSWRSGYMYFDDLDPTSDNPDDYEWFKTFYFATGVEYGDEATYPLPPPAHLYPKSYINGTDPEICPTSRMYSMQTSGFCARRI